jgi:hypothetical protein
MVFVLIAQLLATSSEYWLTDERITSSWLLYISSIIVSFWLSDPISYTEKNNAGKNTINNKIIPIFLFFFIYNLIWSKYKKETRKTSQHSGFKPQQADKSKTF